MLREVSWRRAPAGGGRRCRRRPDRGRLRAPSRRDPRDARSAARAGHRPDPCPLPAASPPEPGISLARRRGLAEADVVAVTDVYAAREEPVEGVSGSLVVDALAELRPGMTIGWTPLVETVHAWRAAHGRVTLSSRSRATSTGAPTSSSRSSRDDRGTCFVSSGTRRSGPGARALVRQARDAGRLEEALAWAAERDAAVSVGLGSNPRPSRTRAPTRSS